MPQKPHKLVQLKVTVGREVDMQKLIRELHTLIGKSKMQDRIEVQLNGEVQHPQPSDAELDLSLL